MTNPDNGLEDDVEQYAFPLDEGRYVLLKTPTDAQLMIMLTSSMLDEEAAIFESAQDLRNLQMVVRVLIEPPVRDDVDEPEGPVQVGWSVVRNGMIDGSFSLEQFMKLCLGIVERYADAQQVEQSRAQRRAAARKAPTKAVARPGRVRRA